jgi:hypothetical protein
MALILMRFSSSAQDGFNGQLYQEVLNNQITRWLDTDGNEVTFPHGGDEGVSYTSVNPQPPTPNWYTEPA